jgi:hypothetical protein
VFHILPLTVVTATLAILNTLVGTAHLVKDAEQGIENSDRDNRRSPQPDKDGNKFMIDPFAKNKDVDREQYRKRCSYKIVKRLHTMNLIKFPIPLKM